MRHNRKLSRNELRQIGQIIDADRLNAQEWWLDNAPPEYAHLFDALHLSSADEIPQNDTALYHLLREMYPGAFEDQRRRRLRRLWGLGLLFFSVRGYYYSRSRGRIAPNVIRGVLDYVIERSRAAAMRDCLEFREGKMSLLQWQERMVGWVKMTNIAGALLASGGLFRISQSEWDIVDRNIDFQLGKLDEFSTALATGLPRDGTVCRRMFMYVQSGRAVYHDIEATRMNERGFSEYRNVLTAAEHCEGAGSCVEETNKGWVAIGGLVPIGSRKCLTNCMCYYEYRNPITGEIDGRA